MTRMLDFEDFKREYQKVPVEEYPNNVTEAVPEPMVSVQISTYQHADFIRDCLDGVLMQETDFPVEILIGEDESDDGTREICKEYADKYPEQIRLFLHRRENNIKIHDRPTGRFQSTYTRFKCRGKYIALCEGDDYWTDPQKLQKQVGLLEGNEGFAVSCHGAKKIDASGQLLEEELLPNAPKERSKMELMRGPVLLTLTVCHRNVLNKYPPEFFKVLNGDIFLSSLLGQFGGAKYQSDIEPAAYRVHGGGVWSSESVVDATYFKYNTLWYMCKYWQRKNDYIADVMYNRYKSTRENHVSLNINERNIFGSLSSFIGLIFSYFVRGNTKCAKSFIKNVFNRVVKFKSRGR